MADLDPGNLVRNWEVLTECYISDDDELSDAVRIGEAMIRYSLTNVPPVPDTARPQRTEVPAPPGKIVELGRDVDDDTP
jgi:hypothetical protein